jgi:hypothetical protein
MATDVATGYLERLIEGSTRSKYLLVPVEYQQRVANGIDDGMGKHVSIVHIDGFRIG